MPLDLVLLALLLSAASGLPGGLMRQWPRRGEVLAASLMGLAALLGLTGAALGLMGGPSTPRWFPWPVAGNSLVGLDALSAFFLVPVFLIGGLGALYGLGYWPQREQGRLGPRLRLFWGWLVAGLGLLLVSRHGMAFLLGWEIMALAAFFLVSTEDHLPGTRQAGWLYLVATHVGTVALFALLALWHQATGSYHFTPAAPAQISPALGHVLFFLALLVFGLKAGLMPLHFWLPSAHANAPSQVSAILSGVVLKMGIYGLLRAFTLWPNPPALWGGLLLLLGTVAAVLGIGLALGQSDLKRLLAYSSVENIGVIFIGLGLALLGQSTGRPAWVILGLAGALLHVWNHALFKSLLFFAAGAVVHGARTRELNQLGGLAKLMPWTAALFLLGGLAGAALPPLNGFVSEYLIYLGLLQDLGPASRNAAVALLVMPLLALSGALVLVVMLQAFGTVFLGNARQTPAPSPHDAPWTMRLPMLVLATLALIIGLCPKLVLPVLESVLSFSGAPLAAANLADLAPLPSLGVLALALPVLAGVLYFAYRWQAAPMTRAVTWDCGYAAPTARMQYSSGSLTQILLSLGRWALRPLSHTPLLRALFPGAARMALSVPDPMLDRLLLPAGLGIERWFSRFRHLQQNLTQHYVLNLLLTVLALLATLIPYDELLTRWFGP